MTQKAITMAGSAISSGLVIGSAFVYHERQLEALAGADEIEEHQIKEEVQRIERATVTVAEDLRVSARRIETDTNAKLGAIFEAHEAMLQDPGLREEIRKLVQEELISAAHALSRVFRRRERKFREMTEPTHRQHADDVADLGRRLLRAMAGVKTTSLETMPPGRVLVARRLLPSDTRVLFSRKVTIAPMNGIPTLSFRVGNQRKNRILGAQVQVAFVRTERTAEGNEFYRMIDLRLSRDRLLSLSRSWSVLHSIDESSPLWGQTPESLAEQGAELQVSVSGMDDTWMQGVQASHTYYDLDLVWGARHADILRDEGAVMTLDLAKFDELEPTEPTAAFPYPRAGR